MRSLSQVLAEQKSQQEPDFMTYTGGEKDTFGISDLTEDHNYNVIEAQMKARFGMSEKSHDRQEVVDKWINYNRKFNVGNTLSVLGEASYLSKADDEEKVKALNSYKLFDNMKGAFSDGTAAEKLDSVYDYGMALIVDPVNLVSFGVGKLATGGGSKVAAGAAKEALEISANQILRKAGQTGAKRSALKPAVKAEIGRARQRVLSKALKGEAVEGLEEGAVEGALKKAATKEFRVGIGTETVSAMGIDAIQQNMAYREVGFQDEFSYLNSGLIAGGGFFGYGLAKAFGMMDGTDLPKSVVLDTYDAAVTAEAAAIKMAKQEGIEKNKEVLEKLRADTAEAKQARDKIIASINASKEASEKWAKMLAEGRKTAKGLREDGVTSSPDSVEGISAFLNGNKKGENQFDGMKDIFEQNDIKLVGEDDVWRGVVHFVADTAKNAPEPIKKEIQSLYENTIKALDEGFDGVNTLDEAMPLMAQKFSYAGSLMQTASMMGRDINNVKKVKAALGDGKSVTPEELLEGVMDPSTGTAKNADKVKRGLFGRSQDNLIRVLVTHPGTTALNLLGWAHGSGIQSLSDILRGALYGGAWAAKGLTGQADAVEYATKSKLMFDLQKQKMRNLLNPFATQEETLNFLSLNPKMRNELFRYVSGGVDSKDVLKSLDLEFDDLEKEGAGEKIINTFQTMYGVKAVDILTKTQEFMYNIDKQIRLKYNVSYNEFMSARDAQGAPVHWNKMRSDDFIKIQATAVDDALRNVFAKSFSGGDFKRDRNIVEMVAKTIEDARKYPILGAMVPFGQFFNNTIAFMADYSPISLVHSRFAKNSRDPMEMATKMGVGLTAVYAASEFEMKNMEEGLAWHEERDDDGQVRSRLYDFPFSYWKGVGRIVAHLRRDGEVPVELIDDVTTTFGTANLTRSLGEATSSAFETVQDALSGDYPELKEGLQKAFGSIGSMYISGFSRPLDPLNQITAFAMGDAYNETDRNIGSKFINNSTRYVESIFDGFDQLTGIPTAAGTALGLDMTETPAKERPLEERPRGVAIGRIFGYRDSPAPQAIDKMFADIGKPKWKTEVKSAVPEANNTLNRVITKYLEAEAAKVVYGDKWKNASLDQKISDQKLAVSRAKKRALAELYRSGNPTDKRHREMFKISRRGSGVTMTDMEEALEEIGIDKKVEDLSYDQLRLLRRFLKMEKRDLKRSSRESLRG
jgi:hypothetical protein